VSVCLSVLVLAADWFLEFFKEICRRSPLRNLSIKESFGKIGSLRAVVRVVERVGLCPPFVTFTGALGEL
jgi:hypothetical protein